jgi:hypothetical protein
MSKPRFEVRRRAFDGKFLRYEFRSASSLGILPTDVIGKDGKTYHPADYDLPVVVGIFDTRKAAFSGR